MKHRILYLFLVSAIAIGACGDSTGVEDPTVGGHWTYRSDVAGQTAPTVVTRCTINGMHLQLTQNGTTFLGATQGGQMHCTYNGQSSAPASDLPSDVVRNGVIDGNSVAFDITNEDFHHAGSISGDSLMGTVTLTLRFGGDVLGVLTGSWSAVRE